MSLRLSFRFSIQVTAICLHLHIKQTNIHPNGTYGCYHQSANESLDLNKYLFYLLIKYEAANNVGPGVCVHGHHSIPEDIRD